MLKKKTLVFILAGLSLLFLVNSVFAGWIFSNSTIGLYQIISTEPTDGFIIHFSGSSLDCSDGPVNFTDTAIFYVDGIHTEGGILVDTTIDIVKTDVPDECEIDIEDCLLSFTIDKKSDGGTQALIDGKEVWLRDGETEIKSYLTCKDLACPQNIDSTITFIPI